MSLKYYIFIFSLISLFAVFGCKKGNTKAEKIAVEAAKRDIADIYLIKLDGTIIKKITKGGMNTDPDFSPAGEDIVFISNKDGKEELYLYNLATKQTEQLTHNKGQELSPSFSPDGKEIVFTSNIYGKWEILKINVKNKKFSRLTNNDHWDGFPRFSGLPLIHPRYWSPAGTKRRPARA